MILMGKINYWVVCYILYSAVDHTYFSLYYFVITNKEPQEIDTHFGENNLITFHGIGVVYIMLYLFYCEKC